MHGDNLEESDTNGSQLQSSIAEAKVKNSSPSDTETGQFECTLPGKSDAGIQTTNMIVIL